MNAGGDDGDVGAGPRWRGRRRAGEEEEHMRVVEEVAGSRDGELGRGGKMETDCVACSRGPDAETPGLNIDTAIPEARIRMR